MIFLHIVFICFMLISTLTLIAGDLYYSPTSVSRMSPSPSSYDLRNSGTLMRPFSQGDCGACYLSSVVAMLQYWTSLSVSEQSLMDASSFDCGGGRVRDVLSWLRDHRVCADNRPFMGYPNHDPNCMGLRVGDIAYGMSRDVTASNLEHLIWKYGPVSTSIIVSSHLKDSAVPQSLPYNVDHGYAHTVTVVGFTESHWIIRNSWGTRWGDGGYFYLRKGYEGRLFGSEVNYITSINIRR